MYPPAEKFHEIAAVAFMNAMIDADMVRPTGEYNPTGLLFARPIIDVRIGGDASLTGSKSQLTLPLKNPNVIITVGHPYGHETRYSGGEPYVDLLLWFPFKVWTNTGDIQEDIQQNIEFARDRRQNVFSKYGIQIVGGMVGSVPIEPSPVPGLTAVQYRWQAWFSRG